PFPSVRQTSYRLTSVIKSEDTSKKETSKWQQQRLRPNANILTAVSTRVIATARLRCREQKMNCFPRQFSTQFPFMDTQTRRNSVNSYKACSSLNNSLGSRGSHATHDCVGG